MKRLKRHSVCERERHNLEGQQEEQWELNVPSQIQKIMNLTFEPYECSTMNEIHGLRKNWLHSK